MRLKTLAAAVLIALGIFAFVHQGVEYTTRGRDVSVGPLHMTTETAHRVPLQPVLGALALVGGVALLMTDRWKIGRTNPR